jgi:hypothetical protein
MTVEQQALQLPKPEKLKLMEALWQDLSRAPDEVTSPAWHEAALRETETKYNQGEESTLDWEQTKTKLNEK